MLSAPFPMLSEHFGEEELTQNRHRYIVASIPDAIEARMRAQATLQLERIREECAGDTSIIVNRWYADKVLNELQGGVEDSQHTFGEAVDWKTAHGISLRLVFEKLVHPLTNPRAKEPPIPYDQAIYYPQRGFVHTSLRSGDREPGNRRQALFYPFRKDDLIVKERRRLKKKLYFDYDLFTKWQSDPDKFYLEQK